MSQTSALKDPAITNLDAVPVVPPTTGEGGPGYQKSTNNFVTALSADAVGSTYRICRFKTSAKVKTVKLWSAIASAGAGDIDVAYSDAPLSGNFDGTPPALAGTVVQVSSADNKLFGVASTLVAQSGVDVTFAGSYTQANSNQPMWAVLGLTQDPGGYFDILIKVTTAVTTGGVVAVRVDFVE